MQFDCLKKWNSDFNLRKYNVTFLFLVFFIKKINKMV